jgi:hypothetical protein
MFPQASLKKNIIWGRKILEIRRKGIRKNAAVDPEPGRMASHCHCQFTVVYNRGFVLSLDTPASVYMYICPVYCIMSVYKISHLFHTNLV